MICSTWTENEDFSASFSALNPDSTFNGRDDGWAPLFWTCFEAAAFFFAGMEETLSRGFVLVADSRESACEESLGFLLFDPLFGTFEYNGAMRCDPNSTHSSGSLHRRKWNMIRFTFPERSTLDTTPMVNLLLPTRRTSNRAVGKSVREKNVLREEIWKAWW
jgi:hypothetical protein